MSEIAFIGLGSNLGEREKILSSALALLADSSKIELVSTSSFYETAPVLDNPDGSVTNQPDYLNAACQVKTDLPVQFLLARLLEIEKQCGRERKNHEHGSRTLDLDLLIYGETICKTAVLSVPHPRLHNRAFVLYPLMEIAPDLVVPGKGAVKNLLAEVAEQNICKLTDIKSGMKTGVDTN
ncbi:MAG: 2-amino-4-hydroxy-6-hydroxymethyldihydropteridine diphosphokinase [Acidiferrobacterales bacterium]